ncbi:MAG: hypothetical protein J6X92_01405 [Bacteroidales bacterium]|nr:hypothetical protein [Bacteroidales bacterium]
MFDFLKRTPRPKGNINYFYYGTINGVMENCGRNVLVAFKGKGIVVVIIDEGFPTEKKFKTTDLSILNDLEEIIEKYKMYRYKGQYNGSVDGSEGSNWTFSADFSTGEKIRASGYESVPKNRSEAFKEILEYFDTWRNNPIYTDENGLLIPSNERRRYYTDAEPCNGKMISFRYELYYGEPMTSTIYYAYKEGDTTTFYYRLKSSPNGYTYHIDNSIFDELSEIVNEEAFFTYLQTPLKKENKKMPRWLLEAEYDSGDKIEIVEYLTDPRDQKEERISWTLIETLSLYINRIYNQAVKKGGYIIHFFDSDGKLDHITLYDENGNIINEGSSHKR